MNATAIKKPRTFSFDEADFSVAIPVTLPATPRTNELPFKNWYAKFAQDALDDKSPHLFVPHAYWVEERGIAEDRVTDGYAKGKLRDHFNKWQQGGDPKGADKLELVILGRSGKEGIKGIDEPGLSAWMRRRSA